MPLATTATRSPEPGRARLRARVSAAATHSSKPETCSTPARRSTASVAAKAPSCRSPGRSATTGRWRAAARAAETNSRRSLMRRTSSITQAVPASRASQSRPRAKPMSSLAPRPRMAEKPRPSAAAQSTAARATAADWASRASEPAGIGRCESVALRPMPGMATPKARSPSTRTPASRAMSRSPGTGPGTMAAKQPRPRTRASAAGNRSGGKASTARSGRGPGGAKPSIPSPVSCPRNPPARRLRATTRASGSALSPRRRTLSGRKRAASANPLRGRPSKASAMTSPCHATPAAGTCGGVTLRRRDPACAVRACLYGAGRSASVRPSSR